MSIRPFDWRDIPTLARYRNQCVILHASLVLTRGRVFIPGAMLSTFSPATGILTSVCSNGSKKGVLIGQSIHSAGSLFAQLTFLTPESSLNEASLSELLEYQTIQVGERGAYRLLADVDEGASVFGLLHQIGFAIYSRQRVWKVADGQGEPVELAWQTASDMDMIGVNSLYHNVVPALVQQVEPVHTDRLHGLVYRQEGELLAYAQVNSGHRGIWIQPIVHPDVQNLEELMAGLIYNLSNPLSRPVYVAIRSYTSWLEPVLEDLGASPGPRQAVMVKHLAVAKRVLHPVAMPVLETGQPEVSAPIARSEKNLS
jgi:hypothetical protein